MKLQFKYHHAELCHFPLHPPQPLKKKKKKTTFKISPIALFSHSSSIDVSRGKSCRVESYLGSEGKIMRVAYENGRDVILFSISYESHNVEGQTFEVFSKKQIQRILTEKVRVHK